MEINVRADTADLGPDESGQWATLFINSRPEIGVHLQGRSDDPNALVTVFWCGVIKPPQVRDMISSADSLELAPTATVMAFGSGTQVAHPRGHNEMGKYLSGEFPLSDFSAYRAEFHGARGTLIFWANVSPEERGDIKQGEENIGIAVTPNLLLEDSTRDLMVRTFASTSKAVPAAGALELSVAFKDSLLQQFG